MDDIEKNVLDFHNTCIEEIGKHEKYNFSADLTCEYEELKIESPIEKVLYCALKTIARLNFIEQADPVERNGKWYVVGLSINPQTKIGNYRVDFKVGFGTPPRQDGTQRVNKNIIVECDSQEFHERTEQERRYEKIRDRFFTVKGYKIFHYTGKEILERPLDLAVEIIAYVTDIKIEDLQKDSNIED